MIAATTQDCKDHWTTFTDLDTKELELGVDGRWSNARRLVALLLLGFRPGSCFILFDEGDELLGDAVSFLFLSSVGVAERGGTGDLPRSFFEPAIRMTLVKSLSARSGSSVSLSELLELPSDSKRDKKRNGADPQTTTCGHYNKLHLGYRLVYNVSHHIVLRL